MSQQEGSYCLVHCVDSLIIWLLVDYKKGGTHTQTHTHTYILVHVLDYNEAHSHIAGDRQKHKANGTDEAKETTTKAVVKSNSFQQLPFFTSLSLSLCPALSVALSRLWF